MSNQSKRIVSVIGVLVGIAIIIVGITLQNTESYSVGSAYMQFGADFYTEIYDVTRDVGNVTQSAINNLICAVGWLIISLGAIDICFFAYKFTKTVEPSDNAKGISDSVDAAKQEAVQAVQNENSASNSYTHKWLCDGCNKMRSQTPCEHCGKE